MKILVYSRNPLNTVEKTRIKGIVTQSHYRCEAIITEIEV
mgnify:CR=1 FL=1